jgi:hypothetical protein
MYDLRGVSIIGIGLGGQLADVLRVSQVTSMSRIVMSHDRDVLLSDEGSLHSCALALEASISKVMVKEIVLRLKITNCPHPVCCFYDCCLQYHIAS